MSKLKLSLDEQEDLMYIFAHNGWKSFIKFIKTTEERYIDKVMCYPLSTGNDRELALLKARAEGVGSFITHISSQRDAIVKDKSKKDKEN